MSDELPRLMDSSCLSMASMSFPKSSTLARMDSDTPRNLSCICPRTCCTNSARSWSEPMAASSTDDASGVSERSVAAGGPEAAEGPSDPVLVRLVLLLLLVGRVMVWLLD